MGKDWQVLSMLWHLSQVVKCPLLLVCLLTDRSTYMIPFSQPCNLWCNLIFFNSSPCKRLLHRDCFDAEDLGVVVLCSIMYSSMSKLSAIILAEWGGGFGRLWANNYRFLGLAHTHRERRGSLLYFHLQKKNLLKHLKTEQHLKLAICKSYIKGRCRGGRF